jgi:phage baseplate assembly protein W
MAIQTQRATARYKDFYTNLESHPVRKDLFVLEDADSIKTSLKNLLFTDYGERFFQPDLGGGIKRLLFENITAETEYVLKRRIEVTIRNFEPRVNLLEVYVNGVPDENGYAVTILFSLVNNPTVHTYNLLLTRVR